MAKCLDLTNFIVYLTPRQIENLRCYGEVVVSQNNFKNCYKIKKLDNRYFFYVAKKQEEINFELIGEIDEPLEY